MGTISLGIAITTHLFFGHSNFNDVHPYVQYTENDYTVGAQLNSNTDLSFYAKKRFHHDKELWTDVGVVTGYKTSPVLPFGRVGYKDFWAAPGLGGLIVGDDSGTHTIKF